MNLKTTPDNRDCLRKWADPVNEEVTHEGILVLQLLDDLDSALCEAERLRAGEAALRAELAQERDRAERVDAAYCSLRADLARKDAELRDLGTKAQQTRILFSHHELSAHQGELHDKIDVLLRDMVRAALAPAATKSEPGQKTEESFEEAMANAGSFDRARLDADRTAQPKTFLSAPVEGYNGPVPWAGPATAHVNTETGKRVSIETPRPTEVPTEPGVCPDCDGEGGGHYDCRTCRGTGKSDPRPDARAESDECEKAALWFWTNELQESSAYMPASFPALLRARDAETRRATLEQLHAQLGRCEDHSSFQSHCARCVIEKELGHT